MSFIFKTFCDNNIFLIYYYLNSKSCSWSTTKSLKTMARTVDVQLIAFPGVFPLALPALLCQMLLASHLSLKNVTSKKICVNFRPKILLDAIFRCSRNSLLMTSATLFGSKFDNNSRSCSDKIDILHLLLFSNPISFFKCIFSTSQAWSFSL